MTASLVITSELLARAAEESAGVLYISDRFHRIVWVNAAFVRTTGFALDDVAGLKPGSALLTSATDPQAVNRIIECLDRGERVAAELKLQRKDKSMFCAALAIGPLKDIEGRIIGFQTNVMDISPVRTAERRLSGILDGTRAGTWEWNVQTGETRFNERWAEIVGYTLAELAPVSISTWVSLAHPDDLPESTRLLERHLSGQAPYYDFVCRMRHKDGQVVWVHDRGQIVEWAVDGSPLWMAGTHIDVTDMVDTAEALRRSRDRAQYVLDTVQSVIVSLDATGNVTQINGAGSELFAIPEEHMLSRNWFTGLEIFQSGESLQATYIRVISGEIPLAPWTEHEVNTKSGRRRLLRWHHVLLRDEQGIAVGVLSSGEDITELRQLELLNTRRHRLEAIGTLAGGIAHDLNNALSPAVMGMGLLRESAPSEGALLDMIESSTRRAAQMVSQLLAFAKGAEGERRSVDLDGVLHEVERLVRTTFPKNVAIEMTIPPVLPCILGDATQVHQVVVNLAVNARDAMPHGGRLEIAVAVLDVDEDEASRVSLAAASAGRFVRISISDSGDGIAESEMDRIFDPFFTTKEPDRGTGLGLSTVLGIVKGHGGFVRVESTIGAGSSFHVFLPVPERPVTAPAEYVTRMTPATDRLILLVDDEPFIRSVATMLAQRVGSSAITAASTNEALERLAEPGHGITTVVTDLHMPGRDGLALTREIRERWPDLPVVIVSGLMTDELFQQVRAMTNVTLLPKPFSEQQLREALERTSRGVASVGA